jgi:hypothetical protein
MKFITNRLLKSFLFVAILASAAQHAVAIDGDIDAKAGLGLKQYCQHWKTLAAYPAAAHHAALVGTDTDLLLKGMRANSNAEYVAFAKAGIKAIVGPWIDGLLLADNKFVVTDVTVASLSIAGRAPAVSRLRSVFKAKLLDVIEEAAIAVPVATSGNHKALKIVRNAVNQAVANAVTGWLTTLGGAAIGDGDNLLDKAIAGAAVNPPPDQTKGAFKTAIENLIKTF